MQDDLKEKLKQIEKKLEHLKAYLDIFKKEEKIKQYEMTMSESGFWQDKDLSKKILKELKILKASVGLWNSQKKKAVDIREILEFFKDDKDLMDNIAGELDKLVKNVEELEFQTLLGGEFDQNDAILSINSGAGGTESCDWASMLLRMYQRWAESHGCQVKVMDVLPGEEAGIKNVTLSIKGDFAYGYLKAESGVHRLVRISPFDANKRRHTSFASVDVIAEIQDDAAIQIKPDEIRVDTFRASGKGGQHVNVTDSAVRITHISTNIVTQCQNERSQHQNKEVAMSILKAKLYELRRREQEEKVSKEYSQKQRIEWGSQIRSYVMHPYNMVKDHRTECATGNTEAVMNGQIDDFIHAYLKMKAAEKNKMLNFIMQKIIGTQNERELKKLSEKVQEINALEVELSKLSDAQLQAKTGEFKKKINEKLATENFDEIEDKTQKKKIMQSALEEVLVEAFAAVREAGKRTIGMRHFDVQLIGGIVLHEGKIIEMATGEGKTLVATLAAYLNALTGKGVHVVTVNDYLAKRDREWMGPIYEFLGLSVGAIQHDMPPYERKKEYACDMVYGTNNEFGFDYLRDNMVTSKEEMVQRELNFAIVDEVDSILIDEARTPLIISGPAEESTDKYYTINRLVPKLKGRIILEKDEIEAKFKGESLSKGYDYIVDEKNHTVSLTEEGIGKCESLLGISNLYDDISTEWVHHITQAVRAHTLYKRDVEYVVKDGKVIIVDEFTGRLMPGRRWSDGLHQAVETKEGIKIERENQTLATITLQNYFRMYNKLSGMTGTAFTEANEFKAIYGLDVVVIPTNKPLARTNHPDAIYKTEKEKFNAVVEEIIELNNIGRPILVGTISIEKSEHLSSMLKRKGIEHSVLNAKYHEMEAHIVAQAGRYKGVTIATNMAGRGTDIVLGGNPEFMTKNIIKAKGLDADSPESRQEFENELKKIKPEAEREHNQVVEVGGLHVMGTERHEARRIDNQLRGRSGRQGDPGSSRFYISLEDDLMRLFGSVRLIGIMDKLGMQEGQVIEHPLISRSIETAQKRVETFNFDIRKQILEYDDIMNTQREIIYSQRKMVLENPGIHENIIDMINDVFSLGIDLYIQKNLNPDNWDFLGLETWLHSVFGPSLKVEKDRISDMGSYEESRQYLLDETMRVYQEKEQAIGQEQIRYLERMITLQVVDMRWKEHLYTMDSLREGIGLRAYGQKDPLIEYKNEAYIMFQELIGRIKKEIVEFLFRIKAVEDRGFRAVFKSLPVELVHNEFSGISRKKAVAPEIQPEQQAAPAEKQTPVPTIKRDQPKVGRNDPCPCGSGKKYKKCCGK